MRRAKATGTLIGALLTVLCMAGCGAEYDRIVLPQSQTETKAAGPAKQEEAAAEDGSAEQEDMAAEKDMTEAAETAQDRESEAVRQEEPGQADGEEQAGQPKTADEQRPSCLSIVGDSISTYEGWIPGECRNFYPMSGEITDVSQTWWSMLLEDTGMELCANNSSAASMCAGDSLARDVQCGCSSYRLSFTTGSQGRTPDLIIVYMGTNDLVESVPLGNNDGTAAVSEGKIDNFSDAYSLMLDKLQSEYPAARICCCTLAPVGTWGVEQPFVAFENAQGLTASDYSDRIRLIAGNRGIPAVDLYHCGIEIDNLSEMTSDGVHLTPAGMKCVEAAVLGVLQGSFADGQE